MSLSQQGRIAVYPGTFDPVTNGHMDIIARSALLVDHLVVAVAVNAGKGPIFSLPERVAMVEAEIAALAGRPGLGSIEVRSFSNLLMHFVQDCGARQIVRGLRAVSDFEYEFQMAGMNTKLNPEVETIFLMAAEGTQFISSRFVKEIGRLGGDISRFVSPRVVNKLTEKFSATDQLAKAKQTGPFGD